MDWHPRDVAGALPIPITMSTQPVLDSSSIQPAKRPPGSLKRSASVASLPTPPQTIKRRSRSRGSAYQSSDDEDSALPAVSPLGHEAVDAVSYGPKRRRIDAVVEELSEDREDAFWLAATSSQSKSRPDPSAKPSRLPRPKSTLRSLKPPSTSTSSSRLRVPSTRMSVTSTRRLSQSRAAPVPPTNVFSLPTPPPTRQRQPATPPRRVKAKTKGKVMPVRDSPNNPFLVGSPPSSPVGPKTPVADAPKMTYVFRGKKVVWDNPHFGVAKDPRANLPPEHPDFEPSEDCTPRRLFAAPARPSVHTAKRVIKPLPRRGRSISPDPEDEDAEGEDDFELDSAGLEARGD
ncbi:hypothetical protein BV25DRAFT_1836420 [Artomyces pyxidatus]|uniref:Uncharacterized protein n=1 Tax=Artomyces pyxidatus TaxID=48021 RepID=A0ACB8T9R8_9AGAM|nr:hypothetical protein BV25DRAFT_1836420 [Artomyces pyxidatus]